VITIISGLPGNGKTLLAVRMLQERKAQGKLALHKGIKDLSPAIADEWPEELENWPKLPPGTLLVVDEAQDYAKSNGKCGSPQWVLDLSKHRHAGVDFAFITQDPRFLDPWIRRLANCHIHLARKFGSEMSVQHQWDRCHEDPTDYHSLQASSKGLFRYPKELYQVYKSATLHQVQRRIPKKLYAALALIPLAGFLLWYGLHSFVGGAKTQPTSSAKLKTDTGTSPTSTGQKATTADEYIKQFTPVVKAWPWSAPAFRDMKAADYPVPYCMVMELGTGKDCKCITQQGTRYNVDKATCIVIATDGVFDPFHSTRRDLDRDRRSADREAGEARQQPQAAAPPSVSGGGGERSSSVAFSSFRAGPTQNASGPIPSTVGTLPAEQGGVGRGR